MISFKASFASFGDYDNDGDMDIALMSYEDRNASDIIQQTRIIRNNVGTGRNYVSIRITDSNGHLNQYGATVFLKDVARNTIQTRYVDGGTLWIQNQYDLHFGVDDANTYEVTVIFPRLKDHPREVLDPSIDAALRFSPGTLTERLIVITRPTLSTQQ